MTFLDETGVAELWSQVRAVDVRMDFGTYTGTGEYGDNNPTSLTFGFEPKLLIVTDMENYAIGSGTWSNGSSRTMIVLGGAAVVLPETDTYNLHLSVEGNTVQWAHNSSASEQLNASKTYRYVAIG